MINHPQNVILGPIVTEKTLMGQTQGLYAFWVDLGANKNQIAQTFKMVFNVNPLSVRTVRIKGKMKTDWKKRLPIHKSDRKKAIIQVAKDQKIELLNLKTDQK